MIGVSSLAAEKGAAVAQGRLPRIDPDYCGIVIPPNIAPLNFRVQETGAHFAVQLRGDSGRSIEVSSSKPELSIPVRKWRVLLEENKGKALSMTVCVSDANGRRTTFATVTNYVAREPVDPYLVYRRLNWQFSMYGSGNIGIYQRDLESFEESQIVRVKERDEKAATCVNCHTFLRQEPEHMLLHARASNGEKPLLIAGKDKVTTVSKPLGLLAWHPSGRIVAFSQNRFSMVLHTVGRNRDVYDGMGDIGIYDIETGTIAMPPQTSKPDRFETWPSWSADGKYLYFCSGPNLPLDKYAEIKYDLMRVSFDESKRKWGNVEEVLLSKTTGLSIAQPKISPDGRFLLFCMFPYSSFPGTQPESDLYLMDLSTCAYRRLDAVNSEKSESYHSWSSNGRWFVFSSKRRDGLLTRPYFSYFDEHGEAHKPFLLPQEDPADFYDSLPQMINLPELVKGRVPYGQHTWFKAIFSPAHRVVPKESPHPTNAIPAQVLEEYMK